MIKCLAWHPPFHEVHAPVEGIQRVGDPFQLLPLVDLFGVGAAHDAEQVGEVELDGAVLVLWPTVVQVAQQAVRPLLGLLQRLPFLLQLLASGGGKWA